MEPVGTADILIIIHLVAWHRQDLSNTVEELASMLVGVVVANSLVSKERASLSNRQVLMLKERVEFIDRTFAWI